MSFPSKPGDQPHALPEDIAAAAGMPRGHLADRDLHDEVDSAARGVRAKANDLQDRASDAADDIRDRAAEATHHVRARVSDTVDDARDWVADTRDTGRRRIEDLSDRGAERFHDGKSAVEAFVTENPLLVGVVGLAAGLLLGALLPRTRSEDKAVGPWADEVRDQGLRYARDVTNRGREFVASALDPDTLNAAVQRAAEQAGTAAHSENPASRPH
ncbi:hypothetical protein G3T14_06375 [Methylobacterium sp. BTF04]|uniref:hypothetical protein n=1 Tax=Methylobacterium sp. BTF04 TaxID=2708300 RepID=UPI0013D30B46|nr:hypothetical protein [Methylobacterium sp. BTF04]NEU11756.1 hypothetical protein [Methylobacterium sp. BTF04]